MKNDTNTLINSFSTEDKLSQKEQADKLLKLAEDHSKLVDVHMEVFQKTIEDSKMRIKNMMDVFKQEVDQMVSETVES